MAKPSNLIDFSQKASIVHNNRYDYSKSIYKSTHTKLEIICSIHGSFFSSPANHLKGSGCRECGLIARQSTNLTRYGVKFVQQSPDIKIKGKITCLEKYGVEFSGQSTNNTNKRKQTMINKYGVEHNSKCVSTLEARKSTSLKRYGVDHPWKSTQVKEQIKSVWLERYGVDHPWKSIEVKEKAKNTCLEKYGVKYATQRNLCNILPLLQDSEWLYHQYLTLGKNTTSISKELGIHHSSVWNYLMTHDIKIKQTIGYSYDCILWLESTMKKEGIHIRHALNGGEYKIPGTRYKADGYCEETNTIYEFYGDYWHGNPEVYDSTAMNKVIGKPMGELYQKTIKRETQLILLGYNIIVTWENNWNNLNRKSI